MTFSDCKPIYDYSYGLLGASGCGKTTLLSILVGLKNLDKKDGGQLLVFGGRPGEPDVGIPGKRVGFMPQVCMSVFHLLQYLVSKV